MKPKNSIPYKLAIMTNESLLYYNDKNINYINKWVKLYTLYV